MRRHVSRFVPRSSTVSRCALATLFALSAGCAAEPDENEASALGNNEAGALVDGAAPVNGSSSSTDGGSTGSSSTDGGGSGSGSDNDSGQGNTTRDGGGSGTLDGGARGDGGSSGSGGSGCSLTPNEDGWVAASSNGAHVQGAFFTYQSTGSTITPLTTATTPFTNSGDGKLCVKGSAAKVLNMDFSTYYGAGLGFDLCQADAMSSTKHTVGQCPLGTGIGGIRFTLTGTTIPSELRVSFHEAGRDESTYVLAKAGSNEALFKDGTVAYNTAAPMVNVGNIDSVHFMIPTNELDAVPFDFCVEQIKAVMASGSCEGGGASDGGTLDAGDGGGNRDAGSSDAGRDAGGTGSTDAGGSNNTSCSKTNAWTTTAQYGSRNYGKYTLRNNFWNQGASGAGSQTLWGNSERCWGVDSNHSDNAPKGTVKSYANIQRGWGIGAAGFPNSQHGLAIQVSQLSKAKIRWRMQAPTSGRTWALWDIYFHESATPGADKAPVNLMIQQRIVDSDRWMQQDSSSWPKVTIAGVTFREKRETNTVSSTRTRIQLYVDGENGSVLGRDDMTLDLKAVIDHYVQANQIRASDYLTSIQAGYEIVSGGTYQTSEFWTAVQGEPDGP